MPASATKPPVHDEQELVRRVCNGDRDAAETLFDEVLGELLARLARHWGYAELRQELYLHLGEDSWKRLRTWEGRASLKAWVTTVSRRMCLARARRTSREVSDADLDTIPSSDEPIIERIARTQSRLGVLQAIERLADPDLRTVLRMRFVLATSTGEIAAQLNISENLVSKRKSRGLEALRSLLEVTP
jgi:RNA polymerase sigma factor (sigma-70 family)